MGTTVRPRGFDFAGLFPVNVNAVNIGGGQIKKSKKAHTSGMRLTCILCTLNLVILGICGGVYAFSGFNFLLFLCFYNAVAMRSFLAVCSVSALFVIYAMLVFKPYRGLK